MRTANTIDICGDAERICGRIFSLAADIQDWPALLPHYRYVRILERSETHKVADFGASRDGFPVKWRARQELFLEENRITFTHLRGISTGMKVEWRLEPRGDHVHVIIAHELTYAVTSAPDLLAGVIVGGLAALFADLIVGRMFVHNIAGKTLRCIKAKVESEAG
ncbi:MAG TPA: SRPBCC family protein [Chthonomonadaceae bacterium]|nr:SRPBCC family protein [Chthonomonadaceae bacterium]